MSEERKPEALYELIKASTMISQGDILFNFPIFLPTEEGYKNIEKVTKEDLKSNMQFEILEADIIILSQACDLVFDEQRGRFPVDPVICAAIFDIGQFSWETVSNTNSGNKPTYFLLNKDNTFLETSYIIDFSRLYTVPYELLSKFSSSNADRIRPISPILEKINHHFGNYFSRIGTEYERNKKDLKAEYEPLRKQFSEYQEQLKQEEQKKKQQEKNKN